MEAVALLTGLCPRSHGRRYVQGLRGRWHHFWTSRNVAPIFLRIGPTVLFSLVVRREGGPRQAQRQIRGAELPRQCYLAKP